MDKWTKIACSDESYFLLHRLHVKHKESFICHLCSHTGYTGHSIKFYLYVAFNNVHHRKAAIKEYKNSKDKFSFIPNEQARDKKRKGKHPNTNWERNLERTQTQKGSGWDWIM